MLDLMLLKELIRLLKRARFGEAYEFWELNFESDFCIEIVFCARIDLVFCEMLFRLGEKFVIRIDFRLASLGDY